MSSDLNLIVGIVYMRKFVILTATAGLMAVCVAPAMAAKAKPARCADRVLCRKVDSLSARINTLSETVKTGNASEAEYFAKQGAVSDQMLTSLKAIEAQGATQQSAILLSFADRQLAEGQDAATVANQLCTDSGFKSGKAVDVSKKGGWFSGNTMYLKSVVCMY
jgi:hypothetical protein